VSDWEPTLSDDDVRQSNGGRRRRQSGGNGMVRVLVGVIVLLIVIAGGLGFLFFSGAISTAQPTSNVAAAAPVPTPTPRPATAGSSGAAGTTGGAATDQPPAQAQPPQPVVTKQTKFDDWTYTCLKANAADAKPSCAISQVLSDPQSKAPYMLWRIIATDQGLVAEWQTRTGVMVNAGIVIDIGGPKPITLPFQYCTPTGCQVQANLASDFIDSLSKATKANAMVFPINSKGVVFPFSVKGLPDALAALKTPPA